MTEGTLPRMRQVLLVDDDPDFGDSLADLLEVDGYRVRVARDAAAAMAAMHESPADLLLVDVRLGGANGIELVGALRGVHSDVLWIAVTAYASVDTAIAALRQGAYAYLRKPFHPDELSATLERAFERIELEREKAKAERALRRYEQIVAATADLMAFVDAEGIVRAVNDAYLNAYGRTRDAVVGAPLRAVHGEPAFDADFQEPLERCLGGEGVRFQAWCELPSGSRHFIEFAMYPDRGDGGADRGVVVSGRDLTEAQALSEKLSYQARHDDLTGLVNRREFESRLANLIEEARDGEVAHALCYLDLDQFKVVNDTCGHVAGDELLRQIGAALPGVVRRGDVVARLGGDEFGVLIVNCTLAQARRVAEGLRDAIGHLNFRWHDATFNVGVSIGLVAITTESEGPDGVMSLADRACYAAKESGRNRVQVFREDDSRLAERHGEMQWVTRLQQALDDERFFLEFQPIRAVQGDAELHAWEVLVRLRTDDGTVVYPGDFLGAAERYGLAARLDTWVSTEAMRLLQGGVPPGGGAPLPEGVMLMVNLSGHSLGDERFRHAVLEVLAATPLPASRRLCFEITETAAISNLAHASQFMAEARRHGCLFALDDFGAGLSSFAYLKNLPVEIVKIDGQFVRDIDDDPIHFALVKSINEIGHVMGKQTIAEFVESEAVLERLREIGVDYAQGYCLGRPGPQPGTGTP